MAVKLVLTTEADRDLSEAYAWYEERRVGLGEVFLEHIDDRIQEICKSPELHAKVHENYRRVLAWRFPYAIFYEYEQQTVTIYSIFHTARDPDKLRQRLP